MLIKEIYKTKYTIHIKWSEEDQEYVATCPNFPSLSFLDKNQDKAIEGMKELIDISLAPLGEDTIDLDY